MGMRGPLPKTVSINSLPVPDEERKRPEMPAYMKADPVAAECFENVCDHLKAVGLRGHRTLWLSRISPSSSRRKQDSKLFNALVERRGTSSSH